MTHSLTSAVSYFYHFQERTLLKDNKELLDKVNEMNHLVVWYRNSIASCRERMYSVLVELPLRSRVRGLFSTLVLENALVMICATPEINS